MTKCGQRIKFRWHCQVMQKAVTKNTVEQKIATQISTANLGKTVQDGYEFTHLCGEQ
jgi:hypothetical protein